MKKALDVLYVLLAVLGGLWLSAEVLLRVVLPWQPVQDLVQKELSKAAGRPVRISHISARLTGLNLRGVAVASSAEAGAGELLRARRVFLRWSLRRLLCGEILVYAAVLDGLDMHIVRYADGTFNFDGLFGAQETSAAPAPEEEKDSFAPDLRVRQLRLTDGHILFTDEQENQTADVSGLFFSARNFNFETPFPVSMNASLSYAGRDLPQQTVRLGLSVWSDLKNLDLAAASVQIKNWVLRHGGGVFVLSGNVKNFENPSLSLHINAKEVSDRLLRFAVPDAPAFDVAEADVNVRAAVSPAARRADVAALEARINSAVVYSSAAASSPQINLPEASVYLAAAADWGKNRAEISSFTASGLNSFVSSSGTVTWSPKLDFNLSGAFAADLQAAGEAFAALAAYQPRGAFSGTAAGTPAALSADVTLENVGAAVPYAGRLADFNMNAVLTQSRGLQIPSFSGTLNGGKFHGAVTAAYDGKTIDADVSFHAERLALPALAQQQAQEEKPAPPQASAAAASGFVLPPVHLKARVDIASLDAPYIGGNDILFTADLQSLTPTLAQAHGEMALAAGEGEIKDLNKLTNANILTKVMFGSLSAVSKVINSLNVFAVLNGLGSGVISAVTDDKDKEENMVLQTVKDENGNDVQIRVPRTQQKIDGRLAFELFATDVTFTNGEAEVKRGSFVSDLMSFNLTGDMNFKAQTLDLKVNAAPGKHYEDGIMPLTLTVGGTLDDPKGSMSMTSSVASLVTQSVGNNFVSRGVKKTVGGIFGLFKKKDQEDTPAAASGEGEEDHSAAEQSQ